jgi:hypothetical protein
MSYSEPSKQHFGKLLTLGLLMPAALVFISWSALILLRPEMWSPSGIVFSLILGICSAAELVPMAIAVATMIRRRPSRTGRNIVLTAIAALASAWAVFLSLIIVIARARAV